MSWDGEHMTVHGKPVETVSISEALSYFMNFLINLGNVVLNAHNGRVFFIFGLYTMLFVR